MQSPIDLPTTRKAIGSPVKALFQYDKIPIIAEEDLEEKRIKSGDALKLQYIDNALRIYGPFLGKIVTMDGGVYWAQEISFHTPSEHTINGEKFPLEISIVHYGQSVGDTAKQVVLSFLFKKTAGIYNKFLESLDIFNLPNPLDNFRELQKELFLPDIFFNVSEDSSDKMIPFSFYTYEGSLTKPPCNEKTARGHRSKVNAPRRTI
jgi:carbonic anhydrase